MEGLLSLLAFAVVFYVVMRFGCGAKITHGNENEKIKKYTDPVCNMPVDTEQGYGKMHQGQLYRFCSRDCLDKFEAEPDKFIKGEIT